MKILYVSSSTLPNKGGSSIIGENLARNFAKDDMLVLGSRQLGQDMTIVRDPAKAQFEYFTSEFSIFGRGSRFFDWYRKIRFQPLVRHITALIRSHKIAHVIGVYPNAFYCHAACLAAKATDTPFSAYFHNTYVENVAIVDPKAADIQKEIFDQAIHIYVMSKGMQRFYEQKYQLGKFKPLIHTFNEYPDKKLFTGIPGTDKKQYKLVAIGNFNESNLDATKRLVATIADHPKYTLSLFTHVPKILLRQRGIDTDKIIYEGFIAPDEVHQRLQDYDICVLTHGFTGGYGTIEYQTIFPTRTIPFLLAGKPIFAHSPPGSFLNEFISENKCAALVDKPDTKAILAGLDRIAEDKAYQETLVAKAVLTAQQFYGPSVVKTWKEQLFNHQLT